MSDVTWGHSFAVPTPRYRDEKYMPRIMSVVMMYLHGVSEGTGLPLFLEHSPVSPFVFTVKACSSRPFSPEENLVLARVRQDIEILLANVIVEAKKSCWTWLRENHFEE